MTVQKSANLEGGNLTEFDATSVVGTATLAAQAGSAYAGSYGLRAQVGAAYGDEATGRFNLSAQAIWSLKARIRIADAPDTDIIGPLAFRVNNSSPWFWTSRLACTNAGQWHINMYRKDGTSATANLAAGFTLNTWYFVELVLDNSGASPTLTCYVDGTQSAQITDATTGTFLNPEQAAVGLWTYNATTTILDADVITQADASQNASAFTPRSMLMGVG